MINVDPYTGYEPHSTILVTNPFSASYPFDTCRIDTVLVPYMQILWTRGIKTWSSCQGSELHPGYISGPQLEDLPLAMKTLKIVGLTFVDDEPAEDGQGWIIWFTPITKEIYNA